MYTKGTAPDIRNTPDMFSTRATELGAAWAAHKAQLSPNPDIADSDIEIVKTLANGSGLLDMAGGVVRQVARQLGGELLSPRMNPDRIYLYVGKVVSRTWLS